MAFGILGLMICTLSHFGLVLDMRARDKDYSMPKIT